MSFQREHWRSGASFQPTWAKWSQQQQDRRSASHSQVRFSDWTLGIKLPQDFQAPKPLHQNGHLPRHSLHMCPFRPQIALPKYFIFKGIFYLQSHIAVDESLYQSFYLYYPTLKLKRSTVSCYCGIIITDFNGEKPTGRGQFHFYYGQWNLEGEHLTKAMMASRDIILTENTNSLPFHRLV